MIFSGPAWGVAVFLGVVAVAIAVLVWVPSRLSGLLRNPGGAPRFILAMVALAVAGASGVTLYSWATTGHSIDRGMWPLPAIYFSALWAIGVFIASAVAWRVHRRVG